MTIAKAVTSYILAALSGIFLISGISLVVRG